MFDDFNAFRLELDKARTALQAAKPSDRSTARDLEESLPIGVGFLGFILDKQTKTDPNSGDIIGNVEQIDIALDARVKAVWFSFGVELGKYVRYVRAEEARRNASASKRHETLVMVQINSVEEARVATYDWGVDIIVAQGDDVSFLSSFS